MNLFYLSVIALVVCAYRRHTDKQKPFQTTLLEWKEMKFWFPESNDTKRGIPTAIPADVQPYSSGSRTFLVLPKYEKGLHYTLAEVFDKDSEFNEKYLKPYPVYNMHANKNKRNCDAITSAYHMAITKCDQLWVIDAGVVESNFQCPPQLLMFDLETDKLIHRYRFNTSLYLRGKSLFNSLALNVKNRKDNCSNTMVYVADFKHHGIVAYDFKHNEAWRIDNTPLQGISGLTTDTKNLYFNPRASVIEYAFPLKTINNKKLFKNNSGNILKYLKHLGKRDSICLSSAMDSKNNLYCVTLNPVKLLVWNVNTPYESTSIKSLPIVLKDMEFVKSIKVARNSYDEEELWMLIIIDQVTFPRIQNLNETNIRIVSRSLVDVLSPK